MNKRRKQFRSDWITKKRAQGFHTTVTSPSNSVCLKSHLEKKGKVQFPYLLLSQKEKSALFKVSFNNSLFHKLCKVDAVCFILVFKAHCHKQVKCSAVSVWGVLHTRSSVGAGMLFGWWITVWVEPEPEDFGHRQVFTKHRGKEYITYFNHTL